MAEQIRELSGKQRASRSTVIKDKQGNILTEREDVLQRWKEYVEQLYNDERRDKPNYEVVEPGPAILKEEVGKAVISMKRRMAVGSDGIVVEMVEAAGEFGIMKITELANKMYSRVFQLPRLSPILLLKILKLCQIIKLTEMKKNNWIFLFLS